MTTQAKPQQLDKNRILQLLAEADAKWFNNHSGQFKYREHLEFTADYITRNYYKETKYGNQNRGHKR